MEMHRAEPRVQEAGCWVLKVLAEHIVTGADHASLGACTQTLMKAMAKHTLAKNVQSAAGSALRKLASHDTKGMVKTTCIGRSGRFGLSTTHRALEAIEEGEDDEE